MTNQKHYSTLEELAATMREVLAQRRPKCFISQLKQTNANALSEEEKQAMREGVRRAQAEREALQSNLGKQTIPHKQVGGGTRAALQSVEVLQVPSTGGRIAFTYAPTARNQ